MKRVVVKVTNNSDLEVAKDSILDQVNYLVFAEKFRSFGVLTFDVPEDNEEDALADIRALGHKVSWDANVACDPIAEASSALVEHPDEDVQGQASFGTRNITTTASGTVYVKVGNSTGQNLYEFSSSQGGTYSRSLNYTGFLQGGTYTFDQSDSSNAGHPLRFSETPDGVWTDGGVIYSTGVTVNGVPGQAGAYTRITFGVSTPSILFYYCTAHSGMGRYSLSPDLYGSINLHDFWHLDRITKVDRQYLNRQFSHTESGDGVDIYVIDSGVRGASRPTGTNAALHPELYDPDFVTDLNGLSEQQNYRVYQLSHYTGAYGSNNEDDNGHGTFCAVLAAGRTAGVSNKARIYSLKAFNSSLSASYSQILAAYQAVIDHNDPTDVNYKGDTRPAIINASFGPTTPSGAYPIIELNDVGTDAGTEQEILDEIEKTVTTTYNIILARSAGNGFNDISDNFAGPLQAKYVAGARTSGYLDSVFNYVDTDQDKISVGATEYNDRWAYFSNYGAGVTTTAPGMRLTVPRYDWTSNTTYTSTGNYTIIQGTSFSCPIVAGVVAGWVSKNSYTRATSGLAGLSKSFVRDGIDPFVAIDAGANTTYPINSALEKLLPTDPFTVTNNSSDLVISFDPADSSYFLGNIGKKVQLRTNTPNNTVTASTYTITTTAPNSSYYTLSGSDRNGAVAGNNATVTVRVGDTIEFALSNVSTSHPFYIRDSSGGPDVSTPTATGQGSTGNATVSWTPNTVGTYVYQCANHSGMVGNIVVQSTGGDIVGGVDLSIEASEWMSITAENSVNNTLTVTMGTTGNSTQANTGGTGHYLTIISGTHEETDGPQAANITLSTQTDQQEGVSQIGIDNIPVDPGVDFDVNGVGTTNRGVLYPYVDQVVSWVTPAGALPGSPFADATNVSGIDIGISAFSTWANEPLNEGSYSITSTPPLNQSGFTFDADANTFPTTVGQLGGTSISGNNDTTYNITVTHLNSGQTRSYSFVTTGTGVGITITGNPSSTQIEAGGGVNATFTAAGTSSDGSTVTYEWEYSANGGVSWGSTIGQTGHSGTQTATLTVDDDYAFDDWQYRCKLDSATAVNFATTTAATLSVYRIITIGTQPVNSTPVAPNVASFSITASTADAATLNYQWEKSEDDVSWSAVSGATGSSYTTNATTYDDDYGDYYRCVCSVDGAALNATSNSARLLLTRTISISSQPANVTGAVGGTVQFSVTANTSDNDAADITYLWQFSIDNGANWSNVVGGSGAQSATYTTAALDSSYDEHRYRCVLSATGATPLNSGSAVLQVETVTVSVTSQPSDQTADENQTATFTCAGAVTMGQIGANAASSSFAEDDWTTPSGGGGGGASADTVSLMSAHEPSVTYQWQKSDDGGGNWGNIGGATSASYTTGTLSYSNDNGDLYRCELNATGAAAPIFTNGVTLTVQRILTITSQPSNQTGNETGTATFSVTATASSGAPTYQWERSDDGGANYSAIAGASNASYVTPPLVYADDNDDRYRCVISLVGSAGSQTSTFGLLTVLRVITISQQPQDTAVIEGNQANLSVIAAITSDVVSYQWNLSVDDGSTFSAINGANSPTYTTPVAIYPTTPSHKYRCVLTNVAATTVTSSIATLTVNESEFVSAPTTVTVNTDPDTNRTFDRAPTITAATFVSQYTGSTHFSTFWRIRRVSDNVTVYDTSNTFTNGDTGNLTSFTVPISTLDFNTAYNVQVKYRDNNGLESSYTANTTFTTPFVDQPEIQTIVAAFNPTITVNASELVAGYQHSSSDWQFSGDTLFTNIVHQSLGNTANLTSYILPEDVTLDPNTTYYVRIRFNVNPL